MTIATTLPHVNAALNLLAFLLLLTGFALVRSGRKNAHKVAMASAVAVSAVFLVSYLIYHFTSPIVMFKGGGALRMVYYGVMVSHVLLATLVTPMVIMTALRAIRGETERHRALARWTLPLWLYVSFTGVLVYYMLYLMYPGAG
ncbi:MAG: DUF420 domain-containing protein [Alphaproteobacteria bacterium]|nr:DUF420 domain-containing protein [Alphaproteobacteria bacterium]